MANAGKTVIVAALDGTFQRKVGVWSRSWMAPGKHTAVHREPLLLLSAALPGWRGLGQAPGTQTSQTQLSGLPGSESISDRGPLRQGVALWWKARSREFPGFGACEAEGFQGKPACRARRVFTPAVFPWNVGFWDHPEPGAPGGERGEADSRVHGVLP